MIPQQLLSSSLDAIADPFGVFSAVRDPSGGIADFRIEYLNLAGAASHPNAGPREAQISGRLRAVAPFVTETPLFAEYVKLVESGQTIDRTFLIEHPLFASPRTWEIRATKLGDGFVSRWRESAVQAASGQPAADSAEQLRALNETLELRVRERTLEAQTRAQQLRDLALALADAEGRERKRLAQILHDQFQQTLSAAKLKAGILRRMTTAEKVKEGAAEVERLLEQAMAQSRALVVELNPPVLYDAGLNAAVGAMARSLEQQHTLKISVDLNPRAEPALEQVRVLLFEAIRELLANVVHHARAKSVTLSSGLSFAGQVEIVVTDDGGGFDVEVLRRQTGKVCPFGIIEIRERLNFIGGDLDVTSQVGRGTRVRLLVPPEFFEGAPERD